MKLLRHCCLRPRIHIQQLDLNLYEISNRKAETELCTSIQAQVPYTGNPINIDTIPVQKLTGRSLDDVPSGRKSLVVCPPSFLCKKGLSDPLRSLTWYRKENLDGNFASYEIYHETTESIAGEKKEMDLFPLPKVTTAWIDMTLLPVLIFKHACTIFPGQTTPLFFHLRLPRNRIRSLLC